MDPHLSPSDRAFLLQWLSKARQDRVPIMGSLELTRRCNLHCKHCYLPANRSGLASSELDLNQWLSIVDQLAEAGCLFLLLTGGDPFLRDDFDAIYRAAKRAGMLVSVFCNGTLVTQEHCRLFQEMPPRHVEISLYGATQETYETVTGVPGSYDRCIRGIERLLEAEVQLRLKTVVMTLNAHEYDAMMAMAERYECSFHMDSQIFARLDGDTEPLQYRVDPEEAIQYEFSTVAHRRSWEELAKRCAEQVPADKLYLCGAGVCGFHVTSSGSLQPCILSDDVRYDLTKGAFAEGWFREVPKIHDLMMPSGSPCAACESRLFCGMCPPISRRETGKPMAPDGFLCKLAAARHREATRTT